MTDTRRNRLGDETSPYLKQHSDNPVDWYPWGEEALALARELDRPLLLSIGYSACHWCHVMAHESFENERTAALMNERFVNVKVDREERPDIDRVYQTSLQVLTQQSGGWPLTMFLEPDAQRPFFGGTYFPPEPRHGLPAFEDLLQRVADYFAENRAEIRRQGDEIGPVFASLNPQALDDGAALGDAPIDKARAAIAKQIDREYGGLGSAPKFPQPAVLERLLRHWRETASAAEPDVEALFYVSLTCARMAEGGIYDQLGGGFFRYSVDRYWQIPHFEKMLYDNGPLVGLYAQLALATGEPLFARVARESADYLIDDFEAKGGGFFSSRDADSEGEEGRYYVWTPESVANEVDEDGFELLEAYFGLDEPANFEGAWHLTVRRPLDDFARELGEDLDELGAEIDRCRERLLRARETRTPPARDEKRLTAWNALAIRGLAIAGRCFNEQRYVAAAARAADFIAESVVVDDRLHASNVDGQTRFAAYLDDHAFLLDALLELLQARFELRWLSLARWLADELLARFEDPAAGGFFFTAADAETLIARPKPLADEALPSGNGVAALALQRLGFLLGDARYLTAAERTLRFAWHAMDEYPQGHVTLISALEEYHRHPEVVVLRGDPDDIERWRRSAAELYAPRRLVFAIARDTSGLPGALADRKPRDGETVAYRCIGSECSLPLTSFEALAAAMRESNAG